VSARYSTKAIILRRIDYGEADRVVTFLTPDRGKIAVMAKGVRREKSKLAGGIELFSETEVTIVEGRGDLGILASARLVEFYRNIITDYHRVTSAYQVIKFINDLTEDDAGSEFYELLNTSLVTLNNLELPVELSEAWYELNILKLMGLEPDLRLDSDGNKLEAQASYRYDLREGSLTKDSKGNLSANHIKTWRLLLTQRPEIVAKVKGALEVVEESAQLIDRIYKNTPGA